LRYRIVEKALRRNSGLCFCTYQHPQSEIWRGKPI
jgi:hypothetical protein